MPNIMPLLSLALETSTKNPTPATNSPLAVLITTACAASLSPIHITEPQTQQLARRKAHHRDQSVEDFRAQQIGRIECYRNPYRKFLARRYLDRECEALALWEEYDRRVRGGGEVQVYPSGKVGSGWGGVGKGVSSYLRWLARVGPKGPSHLYRLVREEGSADLDWGRCFVKEGGDRMK